MAFTMPLTVQVLPRYKTRHCLAYLLLCAMIASLTVTSSRSASSLLTNALENGIEASDGRFWLVSIVSWILIALTGVWSTDFLNKAMMHFGTNEVVPVYYTTFTIASVAAGGLVYSEPITPTPNLIITLTSTFTPTLTGILGVLVPDRPCQQRARHRAHAALRLRLPLPIPR